MTIYEDISNWFILNQTAERIDILVLVSVEFEQRKSEEEKRVKVIVKIVVKKWLKPILFFCYYFYATFQVEVR